MHFFLTWSFRKRPHITGKHVLCLLRVVLISQRFSLEPAYDFLRMIRRLRLIDYSSAKQGHHVSWPQLTPIFNRCM